MNTQITEDYVSFETAKLLKEKGYKSSFNGYYNNAGCVVDKPNTLLKEPEYQYYERVSLYMAMKWLREVHNKNIILNMVSLDEDCYVLWTFNIYCNKNYKIMWGTKQPKYNTYEEAAEAAIKYCLTNLI